MAQGKYMSFVPHSCAQCAIEASGDLEKMPTVKQLFVSDSGSTCSLCTTHLSLAPPADGEPHAQLVCFHRAIVFQVVRVVESFQSTCCSLADYRIIYKINLPKFLCFFWSNVGKLGEILLLHVSGVSL